MRLGTFSRAALFAAVTFACAGCATPAEPSQVEAALGRIADQCGLQRSVFEVSPSNDLYFRPDPDDTYESVSCALEKSHADTRLRILNMGFVGNEDPAENESNAQAN